MKRQKWPAIILGVALLLCLIAVGIITMVASSAERKLADQLELGQKYLDELDYEQAIVAYEAAIAIDPKCEEAYLALSEAYIGLGEYDAAIAVLKEGYALIGDARLEERLEELTSKRPTGDYKTDMVEALSPGGEEVLVGNDSEELGGLYQLFEEGDQGNLLAWEEVTFFGHSIPDLNYQTARELLLANGFSIPNSYSEIHDDNCKWLQVELGDSGSTISIMQYDEKDFLAMISYQHLNFYDGSCFVTQMRGIRMRDSFAEVLAKLGFSNADTIAEYVNPDLAVEETYISYYDAAHNFTISLQPDYRQDDHLREVSLHFDNWDEDGSVSVWFGFDEEFQLKEISIFNAADEY